MIQEPIKFTVAARVGKFCTGCGLDFYNEIKFEPQAFEAEELMTDMFKQAVRQILKFPCPRCHGITKQTHWYPKV